MGRERGGVVATVLPCPGVSPQQGVSSAIVRVSRRPCPKVRPFRRWRVCPIRNTERLLIGSQLSLTEIRYDFLVSNSPFSVLPNQPALDHERFSTHRKLESMLKSALRGDVCFDLGSRALYAADASNYRQLPIGVVMPRDAADVEAALASCRATGAAVLARGAGTSLAGQCANVAVVFDYSRYMHALTSIDPAAKLARVEPGIVLDRHR